MKFLLGAFALIPVLALAQAPGPGWKPDKPVEFIIGAAPGGANDRIGRSLQRALQDNRYGTINIASRE